MNKSTGRHDNCGFIKADFMNIPVQITRTMRCTKSKRRVRAGRGNVTGNFV